MGGFDADLDSDWDWLSFVLNIVPSCTLVATNNARSEMALVVAGLFRGRSRCSGSWGLGLGLARLGSRAAADACYFSGGCDRPSHFISTLSSGVVEKALSSPKLKGTRLHHVSGDNPDLINL